ncbi:MAG: ParB/RepB/Spo0J family partition protein [Gammaproteobacteria bacterium]|nr:ParB/RepB/Spo0J family partition protein [Gammaproteobacteria bacterium]MCP5426098.1 ParB/RepB/Spo0J family partition protein [Gammaproteobacteria bacterium]
MIKRKMPRLSDFIGSGGHEFKGSLLTDTESGTGVHTLGVEQLRRSEYQPRTQVDDQELEELAQSIRELGVIEPIAVRPLAEAGVYEIMAGDRRWRAAQQAGLSQVPVIVHDVDDRTAALIALVENLQRSDLNPIDEARALNRLLKDHALSQEQVAQIVGKSQSAISRSLGLLNLTPTVQDLIHEGMLEAGHAKVLLGLGARQQKQLADLTVAQGLTVRELERQKALFNKRKTITGKLTKTARDPDLVRMENRLQERLGSPVKLKYQTISGKGKIEINFSSLDECNGILERMGLLNEDDWTDA